MSRRKLSEHIAGRDPSVFGANIRRRREEHGWTRQRLCQETGVSQQTLRNIERGMGCTPSVERKLVEALRSGVGKLWQPQTILDYMVHRKSTDRWFFSDVKECERYFQQHRLSMTGDPMRHDPDAIQDENERHRIGRAGLANWFVRVMSVPLPSGLVLCSIVELFREAVSEETVSGAFQLCYCIRGDAKVIKGDKVIELEEGDSLTFEANEPHVLGPLEPIRGKDLPPLILLVEVDPYRTVPLVRRPQPFLSPTQT